MMILKVAGIAVILLVLTGALLTNLILYVNDWEWSDAHDSGYWWMKVLFICSRGFSWITGVGIWILVSYIIAQKI